ncbi:neprilysin-2-like [Musca autumnalis]|uniref:neprilysin-2-like n=1 Tax=Musca autumnalis TaxID=221902 RepID=UPI003CFA1F8D
MSLHETSNLLHQRNISSAMNTDIKPCADFYTYTCDHWFAMQEDRYQEYYTKVPGMLDYKNIKELIGYLSNDNSMRNKPQFAKKVQDLYKMCMNSRPFIAQYYMYALTNMEDIQWILFAKDDNGEGSDDDEVVEYDWIEMFAVASKYGMNHIFVEALIAPMDNDPHHMYINLRKYVNAYGFDRLSNHDVRSLEESMDTENDLWSYFRQIKDFENTLKEIEAATRPDAGSKKLWEIQDLPFEWLKSFLIYFMKPATVDPHMKVVLSDVEYMKALDELLQKTDKKFLRRYVEMRFLSYFDQTIRELRDLPCLSAVRRLMPLAMNWIFEDLHPLDVKANNELQEMFTKILHAVNRTMHMDHIGVVDRESLHKLSNMKMVIGNLPRHNTTEILEEFYEPIKVQRPFYRNYLTIQMYYHNITLTTLATFTDTLSPSEWYDKYEGFHYVSTINIKYYPAQNLLLVPSYLLRPPYYDPEFEDIFKYSFFGSTLASAVISTLKFNGINPEEINIIQTVGGFKTAYDVFFSGENVEQKQQQHLKVSGGGDLKDFTFKQLFFINFMHKMCNFYANDYLFNNYMTYLPEFATTFDCKIPTLLQVFTKSMKN